MRNDFRFKVVVIRDAEAQHEKINYIVVFCYFWHILIKTVASSNKKIMFGSLWKGEGFLSVSFCLIKNASFRSVHAFIHREI